jgi:hypothetical protein
MRPLDPILEKLRCAQTAFFQAADSVSPEQWKTHGEMESFQKRNWFRYVLCDSVSAADAEGRNAGDIASGARTNVGVSGGDVEEGFEYVLLAASLFGNVKTGMNGLC